jgi:Molecular chaperone GrpE (heat shock protein)
MEKEKNPACEAAENEACGCEATEGTTEVKEECTCGCETEATCEATAEADCDCASKADDGTEAQKLENELEKVKKELDEAKGTLLRTVAEYDNYRKRTVAEKEASFNNGVSSTVKKLLGLLDTLAMAEAVETTDVEYKKGITLILTRATDIFASMGITEIDALGQPFDPNLHAAVMQEEAEEGTESGIVTKVLQKGYILGDRVVRHASVAVSN